MLTANFEEQRGQHGRSYESAEAQFEVNMQNLHRMVRELNRFLNQEICKIKAPNLSLIRAWIQAQIVVSMQTLKVWNIRQSLSNPEKRCHRRRVAELCNLMTPLGYNTNFAGQKRRFVASSYPTLGLLGLSRSSCDQENGTGLLLCIALWQARWWGLQAR